MASKRSSRSHSKSGPGRYHGEGAMFIVDDQRIVRDAKRRFPVAGNGGNWQGTEHLSYREHDQCTRAALSDGSYTAYALERARIIATRRARKAA